MAPGLQTPAPPSAAAATAQHQPRRRGQLSRRQGQGRFALGPLLGGSQELPATARLEGVEGQGGEWWGGAMGEGGSRGSLAEVV
jgi:hypothetical protein